jgi:hypothetical protein
MEFEAKIKQVNIKRKNEIFLHVQYEEKDQVLQETIIGVKRVGKLISEWGIVECFGEDSHVH